MHYPRIFYNNFEIVDVQALAQSEILKNFTEEVYATNGIYRYRWGDAPLRYYGLNLAFPRSLFHEFCDVDYFHSGEMRATCYYEDS